MPREVIAISYQKLIADSIQLAHFIKTKKKVLVSGVFGIPTGGVLPAYIIAKELGVPLISNLVFVKHPEDVLVVDDLIDSGKTLQPYIEKGFKTAVLYKKQRKRKVNVSKTFVFSNSPDVWISLPHEASREVPIEDNVTRILQYLGEDTERDGLRETPKRVIKALKEMTKGYNEKVEDILTVFDKEGYDEMVLLRNIEFTSLCEHHMLPFSGVAHIAYIPSKQIVGISKLARVLDIYSKRLQNQERITEQIATSLTKHLKPLGVAVIIESQHFCMKCRGVMKQNSTMVTSKLTGVFRDDKNLARQEFLSLISRDN